MFEKCRYNQDRECAHCTELDNGKFVCMMRNAKIAEDGFSYIDIQKHCPLTKIKQPKIRYHKDKYGRRRTDG